MVTHLVPVGEFPGPYSYGYAETTPPRYKALFLGKAGRSFFGNHQRLYLCVLGQPGYGDKWPSQ